MNATVDQVRARGAASRGENASKNDTEVNAAPTTDVIAAAQSTTPNARNPKPPAAVWLSSSRWAPE
jgi:hypothetical protein